MARGSHRWSKIRQKRHFVANPRIRFSGIRFPSKNFKDSVSKDSFSRIHLSKRVRMASGDRTVSATPPRRRDPRFRARGAPPPAASGADVAAMPDLHRPRNRWEKPEPLHSGIPDPC